MAKEFNIKAKSFIAKAESVYQYNDENTVSEAISKILLYSRDISLDKIADVIGGKEEKNKVILIILLKFK